MLDFRKGLKAPPSFEIDSLSLLNLLFIVFMFTFFSIYFIRPVTMNVRLPAAVTSDIQQDKLSIVITSENIIYINSKVASLRELRDLLAGVNNDNRAVFIKADRRATIGRVAEVWDLGLSLGVKRIDVATD